MVAGAECSEGESASEFPEFGLPAVICLNQDGADVYTTLDDAKPQII